MAPAKKKAAMKSTAPKEKVRKAKQISQLEHAKRKSMWVGSKKIQTNEMYCLSKNNKSMKLTKIKFAPAWYKIVDEIFVNGIDQWVTYPKKVSELRIKFDRKTGTISIRNNGPSIGTYMVENLNGKKMYVVQLIASEFLSGDNLDDDDDRVTGGTNGAGLKLTNAFSDRLTVTTVDTKTKKHYTQTFRDRLLVIEEPTIRKTTKEETSSFTEIEFLPSYEVFGYEGGYKLSLANDLEKLIISRAYQAAAFTTANVYYNDEKIEIPNFVDETSVRKKKNSSFTNFSYMFLPSPEDGLFHTKIVSADAKLKKHPWEVCIGVSDGKFRQISLINGIYVYNGGSHIKHLQNQLVDNLKGKVEKLIKKSKTKFNANYILNNLFVFFKANIVTPEFTSQIKDANNDPIEKFESYKFKSSDYTALWNLLEPHIMSMFLDKYKDKEKNRVVRGAVNVPKCTDAKFAGHKTKAKKCTLIICEGDSAMGTVHTGVTHKSTTLDYDYYGTFSIQGVPMNARKNVSEYKDKKTKKITLIRNNQLQKNERLASLVKVLGLDFEKSYDESKEGDKELESLRYAKITAAVDQDDDGKGNIFGLIVNFFTLFWPGLVKRGFITRFNTPIVRLYPKNKKKYVEEFESLKVYESWVEDKYGGDEEKIPKDYTIKYYKGLGSHKKSEIPPMFKNFEDRLCKYTLDKDALKKLEAYFGTSTDARKKELATPVTREETIGKIIAISELLDRDLKAYQRDNIMRKLPHLMDGAVPSRRKIIFTARKVWATGSSEMKVNAFVNETSKSTHYHHGETSLAGTVTKMAQDFPGSRHMPFILPLGQFGTRSMGGTDAASPRYTFTQLNKRLCFAMFPKDDDFLLKYTFDDGMRCEPEFFAPIIPMSILEHMELPATGWKVKLWARNYKEVIANTRALITGTRKKAKPMKIWLKDNIGDIRTYKNRQYSVGKDVYDKKENAIIVTELPLGKYSSSFIGDYSSDKTTHLCNKPQIKGKAEDKTNDDGVYIKFNLTETGWKEISDGYGNETFDCVEDFMNLKTSLDENINMIGIDGTVMEFKKYEHVIDAWFPMRKQLYAERIDRHIVLTNLMIIYLKNIIKFTKKHHEYNITPKTSLETFDSILTKNKYDTFNDALLHSPKYATSQDLQNMIINNISEGTSYEYLIKLSYRDMIETACIKRKKQLAEYEQKLKDLTEDDGSGNIFKGGNTWLKEIDVLEETIELGIKKGWFYGKDNAKFRD
jgi:DNA topoisomerase-2